MLPKYLEHYSRGLRIWPVVLVLVLFLFGGCAVLDKLTDPVGEAFGRVLVKSEYCSIPEAERQAFIDKVNAEAVEAFLKEGGTGKLPQAAVTCQ